MAKKSEITENEAPVGDFKAKSLKELMDVIKGPGHSKAERSLAAREV